MNPEIYMKLALEQAALALACDEVPVGAVVLAPSGFITQAYNQPIRLSDPSAHAEVLAIRAMAEHLGNYRLSDCILYVTLQPCCMCSGLIDHARIKKVFYGTREHKYCLDYTGFHFEMHGPILEHESQSMLRDFFKLKRQKKETQGAGDAFCQHEAHRDPA